MKWEKIIKKEKLLELSTRKRSKKVQEDISVKKVLEEKIKNTKLRKISIIKSLILFSYDCPFSLNKMR